mgnify:FL=1
MQTTVTMKEPPFYLKDEQIEWVEKNLDSMTLDEKIGQLFLVIGLADDEEELVGMYRQWKFGGIMFRPAPAASLRQWNKRLQKEAKIPLLIAANLENGGSGAVLEGTPFGSQMQVAATGEKEQAYRLGRISASEGKAAGVNLAFAPVCDIDRQWRNPITNTRTYGGDPETVLEMCSEYLKGASKEGVAVSIKHFPGDGCDERDQHLVASVNDLSCEEWDTTYGKIYKTLIEHGAQTVMAGHIMQPAYTRYFAPGIRDEEILPASCSKELINGLLRGRLGFKGVVLTDAANMLGYCTAMKRSELIPATINAGVDMILFGRNVTEDMGYLKAAVQNGTVTEERLDEAVTRVLALKASMGLHVMQEEEQTEESPEIIGCPEHMEEARECADKAITLVKDTQKLLPVRPETHKRVWLHISGDKPGFTGGSRCRDWVIDALKQAGFSVDVYDTEHMTMEETMVPVEEIAAKYDVIMYFSNVINASYQTTARIQWAGNVAQEAPYFTKEVPTLLVNLGNPYGAVDVPMIPTVINTYHASKIIVDEVVKKIMGESEFKGHSPVDPFCGKWGTEF